MINKVSLFNQYGSGTADNTNHGIGYVSGNGWEITMDSHGKILPHLKFQCL